MTDNANDSRVWFITGTSSGLGKALASAVLANGERVVATARNPATLADLKAQYPAEHLLVLALDVTDAGQVTAAFEATKRQFGRLDVVVNMAGYGVIGGIEEVPEEVARKQLEVLFWGPVRIMKEKSIQRDMADASSISRHMADTWASKRGRSTRPGSSVRSPSTWSSTHTVNQKLFDLPPPLHAALEGFTEAFTKEMPPEWNIRGVIVQPGGFDSSFLSNIQMVPPHPAYDENSPGMQLRKMIESVKLMGDVDKAAQVLIKISKEKNPPLRVQLGPDAWYLVSRKARQTFEDAEQWAEVSQGTNLEGYDAKVVLEHLKAAYP
ncbi:hypothetical protein EW146_g7084 [Bondarzewia mesenterica]|uniref:NAD(P)-binding protein n=1 Tax=Bondarzewia mesenterica TaxID=1095465 RepID=A0A4S4LLS5_9AGAM|nr:hypothetical protein EW146_g7084 [Bondarzewia mesenterica]